MKTLRPFSPTSLDIRVEGEITQQGPLLLLRFALIDSGRIVQDSLVDGAWKSWDRGDELWKTTCFEAFISEVGKENYWEVNLSPTKQKWNLYRFDDYRKPHPPQTCKDFDIIEIEVHRDIITCTLKAKKELPEALEVNLTAVIRTQQGIHYYALHHAPNKPDFHYRRGMRTVD